MDKRKSLTILLELLWWVITAVLVGLVLYPIHKAMYVWPFQGWNVVFIVALITFARYTFLLPHTFLARLQEVKVVLILLMFPATFILMNGLTEFMTYIEEHTWDPITGHLPPLQKRSMEQYLWTEMIFFGVGSILSAPFFAVRLFRSIWRVRNKGTV